MKDESSLPDTPLNESDLPKPVSELHVTGLLRRFMLPATAVTAAGAFFVLIGGTTGAARGGTRTCQLKWEERQIEIEQAIAAENAQNSLTFPTNDDAAADSAEGTER